MKKNYRKSAPEKSLLHVAAITVFAIVAVFACLVCAGFLKVRLPWADANTERTKTPGELAYESYLASLTTGQAPDTTSPGGNGSTTTSGNGSNGKTPQYPALADLIAEGYKITYSPYDSSTTQLARITIDGKAAFDSQYLGNEMLTYVLEPRTLEDGGQLYESFNEEYVSRRAIELYMGYIIVDNNSNTLTVYRSDGSRVGVFKNTELNPAYTRDRDGHPLFISNDKYYYIDEETKSLTEADFDRKYDSRGLFFDYSPAYGVNSDESFGVHWRIEPVTLSYLLDRSSYYTRFKVDPRIARALYELDPSFAEKVAVRQAGGHYYNYPFKLALDRAKEEIAREREEAATADTTAGEPLPEPTPEPAAEPVAETDPPSPADTVPPDTEISSPDTTIPETPAESDITSPETDPVTEPVTEPATEPETTEPPYDPILEVSVTFDAPRYYYGSSIEAARFGGTYARAYAFSEGYACVVDDYGVLRVINTSGRVTARLRYEYRTDAAHGYTYMVRTYYQPFYQDIYSLGYYYFDHGLMRVRVLEHELNEGDVVNYITADYDILIDPYGNEFDIPAGYKLISYSDGVLLLEREGRYGYYHRNGYWIAQPIYTYAIPFVEGIGIIGDDEGTVGAVDTDGNVVIPFDYEEILPPSSGVISCYSEETGWILLAKVEK